MRRHMEEFCATSPLAKDTVNVRLGPGQCVSLPKLIRHATWNDMWADFRQREPDLAARIGGCNPDECPRAYRESAPPNLRKAVCESCLCQTCENLACKLEQCREAADALESEAQMLGETAAHELVGALASLVPLLRRPRATEMCQMMHDATTPLSDLPFECVNGECSCGGAKEAKAGSFSKHWATVREHLVDSDSGHVRGAVSPALTKTMTWRAYGKVGAEGDAGGEEEQPKSSSRLVFFSKSGSIIDFLNEFEEVLSKMPMHLFKLQRAKLSSRQLAQNMRPGMLLRNADFGENYTIRSTREVSAFLPA